MTNYNKKIFEENEQLIKCIERSLRICSEVRSVYFMKISGIVYLPKAFILYYKAEKIELAWNLLPVEYRQDKEFQIRRTCRLHHNDSNKLIVPMIKD